MIKAEIIADSKNKQGNRLTTFIVTFPRIILAELNTHRMFSRNSASSRAIPFKKMVKEVQENPFIPLAWQKDHKGMQGSEYITYHEEIYNVEEEWLYARNTAVKQAKILNETDGVTKQLCNRLLEPFMYHTAIITTIEEGLENFFKLRCPQYSLYGGEYRSKKSFFNHADVLGKENLLDIDDVYEFKTNNWLERNNSQAEIHIQALAEVMWDCYVESEPKFLEPGQWHIPFGDRIEMYRGELDMDGLYGVIKMNEPMARYSFPEELEKREQEYKIKVATARCARVSYLNFEGKDDYEADVKLHDRLLEMEHMSPFEHCAQAMTEEERRGYTLTTYVGPSKGEAELGVHRNFKGFKQYRGLIEK